MPPVSPNVPYPLPGPPLAWKNIDKSASRLGETKNNETRDSGGIPQLHLGRPLGPCLGSTGLQKTLTCPGPPRLYSVTGATLSGQPVWTRPHATLFIFAPTCRGKAAILAVSELERL